MITYIYIYNIIQMCKTHNQASISLITKYIRVQQINLAGSSLAYVRLENWDWLINFMYMYYKV